MFPSLYISNQHCAIFTIFPNSTSFVLRIMYQSIHPWFQHNQRKIWHEPTKPTFPDHDACCTSWPFLVKKTVVEPASVFSESIPQPTRSPRAHFGPNCCPTGLPLYNLGQRERKINIKKIFCCEKQVFTQHLMPLKQRKMACFVLWKQLMSLTLRKMKHRRYWVLLSETNTVLIAVWPLILCLTGLLFTYVNLIIWSFLMTIWNKYVNTLLPRSTNVQRICVILQRHVVGAGTYSNPQV